MLRAEMIKNIPQIDNLFLQKQAALMKEMTGQRDELLKAAIIAAGFDAADLNFLKENFSFVYRKGEDFEHLMFRPDTPEEKRIISFERTPKITMDETVGNFKVRAEQRYY